MMSMCVVHAISRLFSFRILKTTLDNYVDRASLRLNAVILVDFPLVTYLNVYRLCTQAKLRGTLERDCTEEFRTHETFIRRLKIHEIEISKFAIAKQRGISDAEAKGFEKLHGNKRSLPRGNYIWCSGLHRISISNKIDRYRRWCAVQFVSAVCRSIALVSSFKACSRCITNVASIIWRQCHDGVGLRLRTGRNAPSNNKRSVPFR